MRGRLCACTIALCLCSLAQRTRAQHARFSSVTLVQEPCAAYDLPEFASLLRLELSARGVAALELSEQLEAVRLEQTGLASVHMHCDAQTSVIAEVADLTTGEQTRRDIPVADIEPAARARALSLAVTALIEASWLELALRDPSARRYALPDEVQAALRQRLRRAFDLPDHPANTPAGPAQSALALLIASRTYPARNTGLLGVELHYLPLLARTRLTVSAEALFGEHEVSDAAGSMATMHLYWIGGGLSLLWATETRPELSLGPFAHIGYGSASAAHVRADATARSVGGVITALGLSALLRAALAAEADLWLGFDVGYTPSGVVFQVAQNSVAGMAELTIALRAGVGLRF